MKIESVDAYQVFDSRGNPTVEAVVVLENGVTGRGMVPSGASTGQFEAVELRDGDAARYGGRSVYRAVENVRRIIAPALAGMNVCHQQQLDEAMIELDGAADKSRLGANAMLAVSMAAANAAAAARGQPLFEYLGDGDGTLLPLPEIQIFGGGKHAGGRIDVQDFMVVAVGATSYEQALEMTHNVYHAAGAIMHERGKLRGVADEGGYWPEFDNHAHVFDTLLLAIERAGYTPGNDVMLSLDIAASDLYDGDRYHLRSEGAQYSSAEFADLMIDWCDRYPIISIEDPMADVDEDGWRGVRAAIGGRVQLVGDDLFTTNLARIERGVEQQLANAVLIKLNQIGTVTETLAAIRRTQEVGWLPVISARSGETEDAFISHLAVATNAGQLKVGSFSRSERMAKWNEVLRIARRLGERARFVGGSIFDTIRQRR